MPEKRVELRFAPVSRGVDHPPTPIDQLEKRARAMAELRRNAPSKCFAEFLAEVEDERQDHVLNGSGKPLARLGLLHPAHRTLYGREDLDNEVILKG